MMRQRILFLKCLARTATAQTPPSLSRCLRAFSLRICLEVNLSIIQNALVSGSLADVTLNPAARAFRLIGALLCLLHLANMAAAQNEEEDEPALAQPQVQWEMQENQFDSWVFQNFPTAQAARAKLDQILVLHTEDVDRGCALTELQKRKLHLAGRGDIKKFFEEVDVVRKKFLLIRKDQNKINEIWQDISPLQMKFMSGLHGRESLFQKTLINMLNAEQRKTYEAFSSERRTFQFRAKVELVVAILENSLPLRDEQRQKLITLVVNETKPPRFNGQMDYYLVMWNISKLPEAKLKPLFDNAEWKTLNQQFTQVRGMEQWFKQNGALKEDSDSDEESDAESDKKNAK